MNNFDKKYLEEIRANAGGHPDYAALQFLISLIDEKDAALWSWVKLLEVGLPNHPWLGQAKKALGEK